MDTRIVDWPFAVPEEVKEQIMRRAKEELRREMYPIRIRDLFPLLSLSRSQTARVFTTAGMTALPEYKALTADQVRRLAIEGGGADMLPSVTLDAEVKQLHPTADGMSIVAVKREGRV